jgi:hypothetical protein
MRSEGLEGLRLPAVETLSDEPRIKLNLLTEATKKATSEPAVDGTLQDDLRRGDDGMMRKSSRLLVR